MEVLIDPFQIPKEIIGYQGILTIDRENRSKRATIKEFIIDQVHRQPVERPKGKRQSERKQENYGS